MPRTLLRITVVDTDQLRLLYTEQRLNRLGFFRVAPVQSISEGWVLTVTNDEAGRQTPGGLAASLKAPVVK